MKHVFCKLQMALFKRTFENRTFIQDSFSATPSCGDSEACQHRAQRGNPGGSSLSREPGAFYMTTMNLSVSSSTEDPKRTYMHNGMICFKICQSHLHLLIIISDHLYIPISIFEYFRGVIGRPQSQRDCPPEVGEGSLKSFSLKTKSRSWRMRQGRGGRQ